MPGHDPPELSRAPGSWPRFVGAVTALAFVAIGIPAGLIAVAQLTLSSWHPLPTIGAQDEIGIWLERELSSSELVPVLLRVLLSSAWLLWLGLFFSVLSSIASSRLPLVHLRVPRLSMFDGLAGWIAAGLTALASLTPRVADATPLPAIAAVEVIETAGPAQTTPRPLIARPGWERVQHGESIEMFAERVLGDGNRWQEVWAINHGRVMDETGTTWNEVWRVDDGWELQLPTRNPLPPTQTRTSLHLVDPRDEPAAPSALFDAEGDAPRPAEDTPVGEYRVRDGDSYWRIAEVTLRVEHDREPSGAEVLARTHELIAGNAARLGDLGDPHMLHTGDVVYLSGAQNGRTDSTPLPDEYRVAAGDSYWRIAETTLPVELGREPSKAEVLARTHELIAGNAARLGDRDVPHMLHTGDVVHLRTPPATPPVPTPVEAPQAALPPPDQTAPPETPPAPAADGPAAKLPAPPADVPVDRAEVAVEAPPVPPVPLDKPSTAEPLSATRGTREAGAPVELLAGMSAVALAGVASGWAVRRRRAAQRARPHQRPAPVTPLERQVAGRDVSDVTWIAAELRLLAHGLPPSARSALTVQLVQRDDDGILEVAFAEIPATCPPPGWRQAAERVWRLEEHHAADELAAVADAPPVLPALVTIGDHTASQLLFNIEAVPGVNVTGDPALITAWLTSVVWELAGGALSERPNVILVDVDVPGVDELADVCRMSATDAATAIDVDSDDGKVAMLHRRVGQWEAWPPSIVLIAGDLIDVGWAERAASPAVSVIAVDGGLPDGLDVELSDGTLRIPAWALAVPVTVLEVSTVERAVDVLGAADASPVADDLEIAVPTAHTSVDCVLAADWAPPTFPVMVHLLGEPFASRDGERLPLSPQVLSALAFLALRRDVSVDDFTEAVWGGVQVPRQRIGDLLTAVRKPIGGRAVVGHIEEGRIRVGTELGTDLAVFDALNTRAQEAPEELTGRMHEIMSLVRGRPFAFPSTTAGSWGWVDHEAIEALWGLRVSTVAWELAGLYLDRGDPSRARDVADQGLIADPLNAALTERLMEAYAALHAVEAAQRVYEAHDRALTARGFDGASEETKRVLERLRAAHADMNVVVGS